MQGMRGWDPQRAHNDPEDEQNAQNDEEKAMQQGHMLVQVDLEEALEQVQVLVQVDLKEVVLLWFLFFFDVCTQGWV